MLVAAKGLSRAKVSCLCPGGVVGRRQQALRAGESGVGEMERERESEQKTFIYILKVDASISPKSISVPHIFGALPTYGTFKVAPRPALFPSSPLPCPPPPLYVCNAKQLKNLSGFTTQQKTRPAKWSRNFVSWRKKNANSICWQYETK